MALLGWGVFTHRVKEVAERLFVRAMVLRRPSLGEAVAVLSLDLGILPQRLAEAVWDALEGEHAARGFGRANVMLLATHTHAAPDGLSDSLLYGANNLGFSPGVFAHVLARVVEAVCAADDACVPVSVREGQAEVPIAAPVLFNRAVEAYRRNVDVQPVHDPREAVDRDVRVLRVCDAAGVELGLLVRLASHGTLVHADTPVIHGDHPGVTARRLEAARGGSHVALVVQGGAGDVTPNHRWDPRRGFAVGTHDDDRLSAEAAAGFFVDAVERAVKVARVGPSLEGALGGALRYVPFTEAEVAPAFGGGQARLTRAPRLGLAFTLGTAEGPGPFAGVARLVRLAHRAKSGPDRQLLFGDFERGLESGLWLGLGIRHLRWLARVDPVIAWFSAVHAAGLIPGRSWVPTRLPAQVLRLGSLRLASVAAEPTTVAARRLAAAVQAASGGRAWVLGYGNAYAGYVTTVEEYGAQRYEGGHTLFGPWTCGAWSSALHEVAGLPAGAVRGPRPEVVGVERLIEERRVGRAGLGRLAPEVQAQRVELVRC